MLIYFFEWLGQYVHGLSAFHYLTTRAIFAALTSFSISLFVGPILIEKLRHYQIGQTVRDDGPQSHLAKAGTPTMGGLLILMAIAFSVLLWGDLSNPYLWIILGVTFCFGLIGFVDDYRKLILKDSRGLPGRWKYFWQSLIAIAAATLLYCMADVPAETQLLIPFFKNLSINLGAFYILFTYFVVVGSSNAVNLTDGLDGLAILPIVLVAAALGVFAYLTGNVKNAEYLLIPYIPGVGEATVFCAAIVGSGLGFLWFNAYPAEIFMGDVGSLSLGAALGILAVLVRQELVLFLMGGLFVAETVSVILQVGYFKMTRRRIFLMAPLHHHYELKGWPESKVIVRFWTVTVILVLIGLSTLKLR